jgi:hypothetical protein
MTAMSDKTVDLLQRHRAKEFPGFAVNQVVDSAAALGVRSGLLGA